MGRYRALTWQFPGRYTDLVMPSTYRLGVDIGGTFTDLVLVDEATGAARVGKLLTTSKDPAQGVEAGLIRLVLYAVAEIGEHEPLLETRIIESLRAKLAIFKCPRTVRFLETIPRTATGKVQRFKLREAG